MAARLHHPPVVEDEDAVRPDDARQPVREDEGGATCHQPIERLLDDRLVLRVHRAQRFVQHQDGRVPKHGAGDRDPLALSAGKPHPALADHRPVAVRQPLDELVGVRGAGGGGKLVAGRIGFAETKVVLHRAVEQEGVLVDDGDTTVDFVAGKLAQIAPPDADRPLIRVVQAKEETDDRCLAGPARPNESDALPRVDPEFETSMGRAARAGIGEPDRLELDRRRQLPLLPWSRSLRRGVLHDRPPGEEGENPLGRRRADQTLMKQGAEIALRPKHLDAHHQYDEQLGEGHRPRIHPEGAIAEHHRRADRETHVGDPATERVDGKHPHRGAEHLFRPRREAAAARAALPEGLESGKPLKGIEELRREARVGMLAPAAVLAVPPGEGGGGDQGKEGEREQDQGDRKIEKREECEYDERGERGHEELGQELAEPGFELFDPLHDGDQHLPGALEPEPRRSELRHLVVEALAQVHLHPGRGAVRDHVAPVFEPSPEQHDCADEDELPGERLERLAREDPGKEPAERSEPPDPDQGGGEADRYRKRDPAAHSGGERKEPWIGQHRAGRPGSGRTAAGRPPCRGTSGVSDHPPAPGDPGASDPIPPARRSTRRSASSSTTSSSRALLPMNPAPTPASSKATRGSKYPFTLSTPHGLPRRSR